MLASIVKKSFSTIHTPILVLGGGCAGIDIMGHFLRQKGVSPHHIRIVEPSKYHYYQPGWTMIGGGLCDSSLTTRETARLVNKWVPIEWTGAKKIDPKTNTVFTEDGRQFTYEHLVIATGIRTNYDKIKGIYMNLINLFLLGNSHTRFIYPNIN